MIQSRLRLSPRWAVKWRCQPPTKNCAAPARAVGVVLPYPVRPQQDAQRLEHDSAIAQQAEIFDVEQIVFQFALRIFQRRTIAVIDLRPTGQSSPHAVAQIVEAKFLRELFDKAGPFRTWTDN